MAAQTCGKYHADEVSSRTFVVIILKPLASSFIPVARTLTQEICNFDVTTNGREEKKTTTFYAFVCIRNNVYNLICIKIFFFALVLLHHFVYFFQKPR